MSKKPTDKQMAFIQALFDTKKNPTGDPMVAKKLAGYDKKAPVKSILDAVQPYLIEYAGAEMAALMAKSVKSISDTLDKPNRLGAANALSAAREVFDRVGLTKKEKLNIEVEAPNFLIELPAKKNEGEL